MRCSTLLIILTCVLLYLVMGAVVFRTLELPTEEGVYNHLQDTQREFLLNYTCISEENLQALIMEVVEAIGAGVDPSSNSTFVSQWDLASAFFFSGTIVTTIGYGNISPKTEGGQLFCIFYALVGIPMFGILLAGVGDHLGTWLRKAVAKVEKLFLRWRVSPTIVRVITAIFSIALGVGLFIAVPIFVFQEVEGWSLLESAYFVVITLTTVGFGDYVAGTGDNTGIEGSEHWYKPLVWFWVLLGLAYFVSILAMIGKWLRVLSKKTRAEMEALSAHAKNIQNLSVDFRIAGKLDDPFKRHRKKRRHGHKHDSNGIPGEKDQEQSSQSESESGSGSSSSSNESESGSQGSQVTQSEHMPEGKTVEALKEEEVEEEEEEEEEEQQEARPDPLFSQPLDFFGENLAFIDESSDAVSGKLHLDPLLDPAQQPSLTPSRPTRRRRQRRPIPHKNLKANHAKHHHTHPERKPNGDVPHSPSSPIKP